MNPLKIFIIILIISSTFLLKIDEINADSLSGNFKGNFLYYNREALILMDKRRKLKLEVKKCRKVGIKTLNLNGS